MPIYSYKCSKCGHEEDLYRTINSRYISWQCETCTTGGMMQRNQPAETVNSTDQEYQREIHSMTAGVHPDQIPEFMRTYPDIPIDTHGSVVFRSHNQRKKAIKALGLYDRDSYDQGPS